MAAAAAPGRSEWEFDEFDDGSLSAWETLDHLFSPEIHAISPLSEYKYPSLCDRVSFHFCLK